MSLLLHSWASTVNGQTVAITNGVLSVQGAQVGTVHDHPVKGYTVRLADYQTIDASDLVTVAKAVVQHMVDQVWEGAA